MTTPRHPYDIDLRYCVTCAAPLAERRIKEGDPPRAVCTACGFVQYRDPKVAAGVICWHDDRVVLLRRGIEPGYGKWVFPGGFLDRGEAVEAAACREAREEACIGVRVTRLLNVYSYPGNPVVVIVYEAEVIEGQPAVGDETLEVGLFSPAEIPWDELAFPSTRDALRDFLSRR